MAKYIFKRLLYVVFVFFIVSIIMFGIFKMVPGDPARMMVNTDTARTNPEQYKFEYQRAREMLGLDKPVVIQYLKWFGGILTGNFGFSAYYKQNVVDLVAVPMKNTVQLNLVSLVVGLFNHHPFGHCHGCTKGYGV